MNEVICLADRGTPAFQQARATVDVVCAGDSITGWNNFGPADSWPYPTYPRFLQAACLELRLTVADCGIAGEISQNGIGQVHDYLGLFPNARYFIIGFGTTDYCPRCGSPGQPVGRETIQAYLSAEKIKMVADPANFCPSPQCNVVYFDAPICACFGLTRADIEQDVREGVVTRVRAIIERAKSPEARCSQMAANGHQRVFAPRDVAHEDSHLQALGFYLDIAGAYKEPQIDLLRQFPIEYDFYLTYEMKNPEYDPKWRLFYPKGFQPAA